MTTARQQIPLFATRARFNAIVFILWYANLWRAVQKVLLSTNNVKRYARLYLCQKFPALFSKAAFVRAIPRRGFCFNPTGTLAESSQHSNSARQFYSLSQDFFTAWNKLSVYLPPGYLLRADKLLL